ncbi:hypothetical protein FOA43_001756 [Brettanomyces nanus]|uniref:Mitochondrial resolvase Ydc2 catalytic domain-containing protein n=1 Tax=Eeniella nana TaxID=13502 RepID=A0A875RUC7_EENNA|nr:uncharacterized protein FOA43_001756 [Brettanomyces nanus]QPG74427.1 hypothetical protein FOA43_001756 [Brettanomyces nanus]
MSLLSRFDTILRHEKPSNSELKQIIKQCGVTMPVKTTKDSMVEEIRSQVFNVDENTIMKPPYSLVSIDVGLKNFSLTRFAVPVMGRPKVIQWCKLNLSHYTGLPDSQFNPIRYAQIVQKTLFDLVIGQSDFPSVIVVERQRFRTNGGRNVHESILKSNAIEYMLFAAIETLRVLNKEFNTLLVSSSPHIMASHWEDYYANYVPSVVDDSKLVRMKVVDQWLRFFLLDQKRSTIGSPPFEFSDIITRGYTRFGIEGVETRLHRFTSVSRRIYECMRLLNELNETKYSVDLDEGSVKKGDDVTDSLLHGLTYLEFESTKKKLRESIKQGHLVI